ncbi:MAG: carboxypeptidase-like regulatory domain-containing protein [Burkholderiaceae bacterium]
MNRWWLSRWVIVPGLMLLTVLGWMVYVHGHNHGSIDGRVVDAAGRPVAGAIVHIYDRGFITHQERGKTLSDASGWFHIADNTSHSVQLQAESPGLGRTDRYELRLWFAAQDARLDQPLRFKAPP